MPLDRLVGGRQTEPYGIHFSLYYSVKSLSNSSEHHMQVFCLDQSPRRITIERLSFAVSYFFTRTRTKGAYFTKKSPDSLK